MSSPVRLGEWFGSGQLVVSVIWLRGGAAGGTVAAGCPFSEPGFYLEVQSVA